MYRIGLIGYGGMGSWHAQSITSLQGFELAAVYDINPMKVKMAREKGFKGYDTLEEIMNDKDLPTLIIATPNNFHKDLSIAALKAGKNVICEKPMMMNSRELEDVIEVSQMTGKLFSVHQNRRWDKDYLIVKKVIEDDTIGRPFYIESRVQGSKGVPGDWRCIKEAGGGMLLDWGVHLIDQIMQLVHSPVREVYTHMLSLKFEGVDDNFKLLLRFENGVSALVEVDTYTFINLPRWHVSGECGTLQIDDFACTGKVVRANILEIEWDEGIVYTVAGPTRTMAPRPKETIEELALPSIESDARDYYRNFRDADLNGTPLAVQPAEALRVMRVIDATFASAEQRKSIFVNI